MCTAITLRNENFYFGRTLDLEYHYSESVTITPRNFKINFTDVPGLKSHYAIIGIATVHNDYPLYYDAVNEHGLGIAGLNFPDNAHYMDIKENLYNIASYELIPWILGKFKTIDEAMPYLEKLNITNKMFSSDFPPSPLHWIVADKTRSITLEPLEGGIKIYENPVGVLTNNPPFPTQIFNLKNYASISSRDPENTFSNRLCIEPYSRGLGGIGLPGDYSSMSRFVRASFLAENSNAPKESCVSQFFHILDSVSVVKGSVKSGNKDEITIYSSCCDTDKGIYYYTTYENRSISSVNIYNENLDCDILVSYPLSFCENIIAKN